MRCDSDVTSTLSARGLAVTTLTLAVIAVAVATALAVLPLPWPLSLAEHFQLQYLVVAVALAAIALAARRWALADASVIIALLHLIAIAPHLRGEAPAAATGATPVRVLLLNVHTSNTDHVAVRALIERVDPDVVALVEVDRGWLEALAPTLQGYAGRLEEARRDNFGVALYHRRALLEGRIARVGVDLPSVIARIDTGGVPLTLILTHPLPPVDRDTARANADQLDAIADVARSTAGARVVLGDLNATPWSRPFTRLVARSGLRDSRDGFGLQATFPSGPAWATLLQIPIDHALVSPEVAVVARRVEAPVGSDHLPVVLDLAVSR